MIDYDIANPAMQKCKIAIMTRLPFLMHIGLQIPHRWNENIPTAQTDGLSVEYNPGFFLELTEDMRIFLMAHELWHTAFLHQLRIGEYDPVIWNKAGDYVINLLLVMAGFTMPHIGLLDFRFKDMTTEQVYKILIDEGEDNDPANYQDLLDLLLPGQGEGDGTEPGKNGQPTPAQIEKLKQIVSRAIQITKMTGDDCGAIPGEIIRALDDLLHPILPWNLILRRYLTAISRSGVSWRRPNKRFVPRAYLPSIFSRTLGEVVFAIDTSGSITDNQLREMLSEITAIRRKYKPTKLTIIDCDARIHHAHIVKPRDDILKLEFTGNGGTSFKPVEKYCDKFRPDLLIYFTDLEIVAHSDITERKPYPIIWINHGNKHLRGTIGQTIHYNARR